MKQLGEWAAKGIKRIKTMKLRRRLPAYEIEGCERRYEAMAEKGWFLRSRGAWFDRYEKGEPKKQKYRIEYCPVRMIDGIQDMSEDQVDFYEDCGWKLVCEKKGVYVFCAPAKLETAELYSDPQEQIKMLKSVHNYIGGFGAIAVSCFWGVLLGSRLISGEQNLLTLEALYAVDWLMFLAAALVADCIREQVYGYFRCRQLIRRVKKGRSLHRQPGERQPGHLAAKSVRGLFAALIMVCAAGSAVMCIRRTKTPLGDEPEAVPYLLGSEVYEASRSDEDIFSRKRASEAEWTPALMADYYDVCEYLRSESGGFVSLYQDLYILRGDHDIPRRGKALAESLLEGNMFGTDGCREITHPDFDYAASAAYTLVAVRGNCVIRIVSVASAELEKDWTQVLDILAAKWEGFFTKN